jgi:hypothetical protein
MILTNLATRHSRAGGNPAMLFKKSSAFALAPQGGYLIIWIPACAGMTQLIRRA